MGGGRIGAATQTEIPVLIVDPEPLTRRALVRALAQGGFDVLASTATIALLPQTTRRPPEVIVVGWDTARRHDLPGLRHLAVDRGIKTVVLVPSRETDDVEQAFAAGATAVILKTVDSAHIAPLIREVLNENVLLSPHRRDRTTIVMGGPHLTPREEEVLAHIVAGDSNRTVAAKLWLSEPTVKFHLRNIYRKLGAKGRTDASRLARDRGLVSRPPVP
jgi:DNA-binding NarL/FixJ family response regulator